MDQPLEILAQTMLDVGTSLTHSWRYLLISVVIASVIPIHVGTDRLSGWIRGRTTIAVLEAVALAFLMTGAGATALSAA
jgi:uncharacterized membrane protein YraQ (UPF0718 family)